MELSKKNRLSPPPLIPWTFKKKTNLSITRLKTEEHCTTHQHKNGDTTWSFQMFHHHAKRKISLKQKVTFIRKQTKKGLEQLNL